MQGEAWKQHRRFLNTTLKDFGMGKSILENTITTELAFLKRTIKDLGSGEPVDPRYAITVAVANVIGSITWGCRSNHADPAFERQIETRSQMTKLVGTSAATFAFPFLK